MFLYDKKFTKNTHSLKLHVMSNVSVRMTIVSLRLIIGWIGFVVCLFGSAKTAQFSRAPTDSDIALAQSQAMDWCETLGVPRVQTSFSHTTLSKSTACTRLEAQMSVNNGTTGCVNLCLNVFSNRTSDVLKCNDECVQLWMHVYDVASRTIDSNQRFLYFMFTVVGGSTALLMGMSFLVEHCYHSRERLHQQPHSRQRQIFSDDDTPQLE